ncbi:hypothetical protein HYC85_019029, partial [Camellia sinensis]
NCIFHSCYYDTSHIAFIVTKRNCFLYLAVVFTISIGTYLGFYSTQIRKSLTSLLPHYPCVTNDQGDTICIGRYGEGNKAFFELQPPPIVSTKSFDPCSLQKSINVADHSLRVSSFLVLEWRRVQKILHEDVCT